jgi:hypothetical protein
VLNHPLLKRFLNKEDVISTILFAAYPGEPAAKKIPPVSGVCRYQSIHNEITQ